MHREETTPDSSRRIAAPTDDPDDPARYWSTPDFEVMVEERLRRLLAYWRSKCLDGRWPTRQAIDPLDLGWALDRIYLADRVPPPAVWRYRLAGARIEEIFKGRSMRGALLTELMAPDKACLVIQRWQPLIDGGCAVYMHGLIYRANDRFPVGGRLLLPLGDGESDEVVGLIGITDIEWRTPASGSPAPELDIHYMPLRGC
ncbi:PAS domain-containing protein [Tistlia consotensis]|uniref:PAS domain-containing protein n=1 Tax=Tistlia consotensis USBA 355 TaxID=560819 RepID=A0A1Y6CJA3_9PROT|nr:PAS domain-containing protein [Tistlia consotensis]SMF58444.1 PAS domain-containing protein [Tistlia consotensis USBA 355]SNR63351.1 PAS domain-containing protein [Tistlia consotensis]